MNLNPVKAGKSGVSFEVSASSIIRSSAVPSVNAPKMLRGRPLLIKRARLNQKLSIRNYVAPPFRMSSLTVECSLSTEDCDFLSRTGDTAGWNDFRLRRDIPGSETISRTSRRNSQILIVKDHQRRTPGNSLATTIDGVGRISKNRECTAGHSSCLMRHHGSPKSPTTSQRSRRLHSWSFTG